MMFVLIVVGFVGLMCGLGWMVGDLYYYWWRHREQRR